LLADLKSLKFFGIGRNKLKRIDRSCFEQLKSIFEISLYGNEFVSKTTSFLNETLWVKYGFSKRDGFENEVKELNENGGYISNWEEFLQQFSLGDFI